MTTQLSLYNDALLNLGERRLSSLSEDSEQRYYLDDVYGDALIYCLRSGFWNFAMRVMKMDTDATPAFGYSYAFTKPSDWVRTRNVSTSETFVPPLTDYQDQVGYWLANTTPLYFRFVSTARGLTLSAFPLDYADFVSSYLSLKIYKKVTGKGDDDYFKFEKLVVKPALKKAQANDAMDSAPEIPPTGSWVSSRSSRSGIDRIGDKLIG